MWNHAIIIVTKIRRYFTDWCFNNVIINRLPNEEQIITGYPIDGAMERSGGGRIRKLWDVCLHNSAIVVRGILVTNVALWDTQTASAPSILLVLLEPHCNIYSINMSYYLFFLPKIFLILIVEAYFCKGPWNRYGMMMIVYWIPPVICPLIDMSE